MQVPGDLNMPERQFAIPEDEISPLERPEGLQSIQQSEPDAGRALADQFAQRILGETLAKERAERGSVQMSVGEVDFEDPELEIPTCIFCRQPYSVIEGRKPYVLPCENHSSCKECLLAARTNAAELRCP